MCHGPDRNGDLSFVLVHDWLGEPKPRERESALAELAVSYLNAHGPASPADLAFWSGIRLGEARRAWKAIQNRLTEVKTALGIRWAPRSRREMAPRGLVRLIPAFDEYLLGWKDRGLVAPGEHWQRINRGGGWLHPAVLADGRAVATWSTERRSDALGLEIRAFTRLAPVVQRRVISESKDVGRFLDITVEVAVA